MPRDAVEGRTDALGPMCTPNNHLAGERDLSQCLHSEGGRKGGLCIGILQGECAPHLWVPEAHPQSH